MAFRNLHSGKAAGKDEIWRENGVCVTHLFSVAWKCGQCIWAAKMAWWSLFLTKGNRGCVPITGESSFPP